MNARRLPNRTAFRIKMGVGACPACALWNAGFAVGRTVIYRRSGTSVTMRCENCGLQWTMTYRQIHKAMNRQLATAVDIDDPLSTRMYAELVAMTEFAKAEEAA